MSSAKETLKKVSFQAHKLALRAGLFLLPKHYYASISSVLELEKTRAFWVKKSLLPGIGSTLDGQAHKLKQVCLPFQTEYAGNIAYRHAVEHHFGPGYGYIEAQALHAIIRHFRPKRIIEVGSGVSTYCMLKAIELNEKEAHEPTHITCIEPYPSEALRNLGRVELLRAHVQAL
ncbi:MAG TPA: hypothetical protein VFH31_18535, partial [Pyrinomonadaceae bacterium]|nr:hypothetical protein [Pyrinomonadaceae bacterium]